MEKNTYIASKEDKEVFLKENSTYIASNAFREVQIPISIFRNGLSGLEAISKYLKDVLRMRFCEIASILNRDDRTIWNAYTNANKKSKDFIVEETNHLIPVSLFSDRNLSVLEIITSYLKETSNLRFCDIAGLLNKNDRTIWTVYNRFKKKRRNYVYN